MSVPRRLVITAATVGLLALAACTPAPQGDAGDPTSSAPASNSQSSGAQSSGAQPSGAPSSSVIAPRESASGPGQTATAESGQGQVIINVTLMNGTVKPNAEKIDVTRGQEVLLNVVSDHEDEVHVHGDYDIELEVPANEPVSKSFVADKSGSVEVESHHPEKIIAILNIR